MQSQQSMEIKIAQLEKVVATLTKEMEFFSEFRREAAKLLGDHGKRVRDLEGMVIRSKAQGATLPDEDNEPM